MINSQGLILGSRFYGLCVFMLLCLWHHYGGRSYQQLVILIRLGERGELLSRVSLPLQDSSSQELHIADFVGWYIKMKGELFFLQRTSHSSFDQVNSYFQLTSLAPGGADYHLSCVSSSRIVWCYFRISSIHHCCSEILQSWGEIIYRDCHVLMIVPFFCICHLSNDKFILTVHVTQKDYLF